MDATNELDGNTTPPVLTAGDVVDVASPAGLGKSEEYRDHSFGSDFFDHDKSAAAVLFRVSRGVMLLLLTSSSLPPAK